MAFCRNLCTGFRTLLLKNNLVCLSSLNQGSKLTTVLITTTPALAFSSVEVQGLKIGLESFLKKTSTVFSHIVSALEQFPPLNSFHTFMYCDLWISKFKKE